MPDGVDAQSVLGGFFRLRTIKVEDVQLDIYRGICRGSLSTMSTCADAGKVFGCPGSGERWRKSLSSLCGASLLPKNIKAAGTYNLKIGVNGYVGDL
jgi:hypothetical protein